MGVDVLLSTKKNIPLSLITRIQVKIIAIWYILLGRGVWYRVDLAGTGDFHLSAHSRSNHLYIFESNILDGLEVS
jgi:hypothetical protein